MPGQAPPGWEPNNPGSPFGQVAIEGLECDRFSLGPFERGPVRLVLDQHGQITVPDGCGRNVSYSTSFRILNALFVNDAALATYLNQTYNMPTWYSEIQTSTQTLAGGGAIHQWSWGAEGQKASTMSVVDDGTTTLVPKAAERLFWQKDQGIVALEIIRSAKSALFGPRAAEGTLNPPMVWAEEGGNFAGSSEWYTDFHGDGTFTIYRDLMCKEPVQPPEETIPPPS